MLEQKHYLLKPETLPKDTWEPLGSGSFGQVRQEIYNMLLLYIGLRPFHGLVSLIQLEIFLFFNFYIFQEHVESVAVGCLFTWPYHV